MSNRNDDIKHLFAHLGLNAEDYLELRRQSGGTETGQPVASNAPPGTRRPAGGPPLGSGTPSGRFNASEQPKVFLPGLTPDLGAPEQTPPVMRARVAPTVDAQVVPPPDAQERSLYAGPSRPASRRWAMVDAAAQAVPAVAKIRPKETAPEPVTSVSPEARAKPKAPPYVEPAPSTAVDAERVAAPEPGTGGGDNKAGLGAVLTRLKHPEMTATDRLGAPRLRYTPRPLAGRQPGEAAAAASELDAVLSRLGRARR